MDVVQFVERLRTTAPSCLIGFTVSVSHIINHSMKARAQSGRLRAGYDVMYWKLRNAMAGAFKLAAS